MEWMIVLLLIIIWLLSPIVLFAFYAREKSKNKKHEAVLGKLMAEGKITAEEIQQAGLPVPPLPPANGGTYLLQKPDGNWVSAPNAQVFTGQPAPISGNPVVSAGTYAQSAPDGNRVSPPVPRKLSGQTGSASGKAGV